MSTRPEETNETESSGGGIQEIIALILKRLPHIIAIVGLGMTLVVLYLITAPSGYEATASIVVEPREQRIIKQENIIQDAPNPSVADTAIAQMESRAVMARVVKAAGVGPDVHRDPWKLFGLFGATYSDDELYERFKKKFKIKQRGESLVIDVTASAKSPELAALLANTYVHQFIEYKTDQRVEIAADANAQLTAQAEKLKQNLEKAAHALQDYRETHRAVSLQSDQNVTVQKLTALNNAATAAINTRVGIEADLSQIAKVGPTNTEELIKIPSVANLPEIVKARQDLNSAQTDLAAMEGHYLVKNPKHIDAVNRVKGLQAALNAAASRSETQVRQQFESAKQTEEKLKGELAAQEEETMKLNALAIPYNTLVQQLATAQALYDSVMARRNETKVAMEVTSVPYHISDLALVPSKPTHPKRVKLLVFGFVGFSLLSIVLVVFTDESRGSLRSVTEAENFLKLPVLAAIPDNGLEIYKRLGIRFLREKAALKDRVQKAKALAKRRQEGKKVGVRHVRSLFREAAPLPTEEIKPKYPIVMIDEPGSQIAESYRAMRASIALLPKDQTRILLFTSCAPDEGKSFSSINYAVSLAQAGFKTLLVDTDLRRPSLHEALLDGAIKPGLSDYLGGKVTLEQVTLPTKVDNLFLITAGTPVSNPAELIERADLASLAVKLQEHHERIVLDSAPVNAVSDTLLLASALKQVILVVRAEMTPGVVIKRSLEILRGKSGAHVLGVVLNRLTPGPSAYHYYHYYGDKYAKDSVYGKTSLTRPQA